MTWVNRYLEGQQHVAYIFSPSSFVSTPWLFSILDSPSWSNGSSVKGTWLIIFFSPSCFPPSIYHTSSVSCGRRDSARSVFLLGYASDASHFDPRGFWEGRGTGNENIKFLHLTLIIAMREEGRRREHAMVLLVVVVVISVVSVIIVVVDGGGGFDVANSCD